MYVRRSRHTQQAMHKCSNTNSREIKSQGAALVLSFNCHDNSPCCLKASSTELPSSSRYLPHRGTSALYFHPSDSKAKIAYNLRLAVLLSLPALPCTLACARPSAAFDSPCSSSMPAGRLHTCSSCPPPPASHWYLPGCCSWGCCRLQLWAGC